MTILAISLSGANSPSLKIFSSIETARKNGNGFSLYENQEELTASTIVKTSIIVDLYNEFADKPVSKFENRQTAVRRLFQLAQEKIPVEIPAKETTVDASTSNDSIDSSETTTEATVVTKARRGRKPKSESGSTAVSKVSQNNGKFLFPTDKNKSEAGELVNKRKEGSYGHKSMGIILQSPGIVYEDFRQAGGRSNDLSWDIKHEYVVVKDSKE